MADTIHATINIFKKRMKYIIPVLLSLSLFLSACQTKPTPTPPQKTTSNDTHVEENSVEHLKNKFVVVETPRINEVITSPLEVNGEIRGNWTFEGQFAIQLRDNAGKLLAESPAVLLDDWMTTDMVPFEATLNFDEKNAKKGSLNIIKANPSGLTENDETISFEVQF